MGQVLHVAVIFWFNINHFEYIHAAPRQGPPAPISTSVPRGTAACNHRATHLSIGVLVLVLVVVVVMVVMVVTVVMVVVVVVVVVVINDQNRKSTTKSEQKLSCQSRAGENTN